MRYLFLTLFVFGCASSQADDSVVSANEVQKETFAKVEQMIESTQTINENTFSIVLNSCMTFCFYAEAECNCKCNTGINKLRNVTSRYSLTEVSQWESYKAEWLLTQKELSGCE